MGYHKSKRPTIAPGNAAAPVQILAHTSTATLISPFGVTILKTTGGSGTISFSLKKPGRAGIQKDILLQPRSANPVRITHAGITGSTVFYGSTCKFATASTAASSVNRQRTIRLVSASSNTWAIIGRSTGITLA